MDSMVKWYSVRTGALVVKASPTPVQVSAYNARWGPPVTKRTLVRHWRPVPEVQRRQPTATLAAAPAPIIPPRFPLYVGYKITWKVIEADYPPEDDFVGHTFLYVICSGDGLIIGLSPRPLVTLKAFRTRVTGHPYTLGGAIEIKPMTRQQESFLLGWVIGCFKNDAVTHTSMNAAHAWLFNRLRTHYTTALAFVGVTD